MPLANTPTMHPELLEAACHGSCGELTNLLNRGAADVPIEVVVDIDRPGRSPASSLLLEGVTPDGDSALHIVAAYGYQKKARAVYGKAPHLLGARNSSGSTPLHCAARAGHAPMAALLVELARGEEVAGEDGRVETLVRMKNELGETALHEAIRAGDMLTVAELTTADPFLARVPENGTSPLFLAVSLRHEEIARELLITSQLGSLISSIKYSHVCSMPLCMQILEADAYSAYQPDEEGSFPIHVAALAGRLSSVIILLLRCPGCASLRDTHGRTFLHVAHLWHCYF